jgi:hypothetical protein
MTGGTPVNLSGYSARMQVRDGYDGGSAIVSITSELVSLWVALQARFFWN